MKESLGIGIMSGTSHDGLDLAACCFTESGGRYSFQILHAETVPYTTKWKERLISLPAKDMKAIRAADDELGRFIGEECRRFIEEKQIKPAFIASHGHTVFHEPDKKITLQIGNGKHISKTCGITVINDFRSADVAMGGQGAPLVPIGDRLLFGEYDHCLNIGGIANVSFEEKGMRRAFDICPANMVLNHLAGIAGKAYDQGGEMASGGKLIPALVEELDSLDYYRLSGPRSLGREWVLDKVFPVLEKFSIHPVEDLLRSFTEHCAGQITAVLKQNGAKKVLVTGGGAYNDFLIRSMRQKTSAGIVLPSHEIIDYKEALIFAFLGLLRLEQRNNVFGSVTGSGKDHCAGTLIRP